jgi:hypothetical protein
MSAKRPLSSPHGPEPSGCRQKLDISPESAPYDALHKLLDTQVFDTYPRSLEPLDSQLAAWLLATIVSTSTIPLNPTYKENQNALALVKATPDLIPILRSAWSQESFREVRNLRKCRLFVLSWNFRR